MGLTIPTGAGFRPWTVCLILMIGYDRDVVHVDPNLEVEIRWSRSLHRFSFSPHETRLVEMKLQWFMRSPRTFIIKHMPLESFKSSCAFWISQINKETTEYIRISIRKNRETSQHFISQEGIATVCTALCSNCWIFSSVKRISSWAWATANSLEGSWGIKTANIQVQNFVGENERYHHDSPTWNIFLDTLEKISGSKTRLDPCHSATLVPPLLSIRSWWSWCLCNWDNTNPMSNAVSPTGVWNGDCKSSNGSKGQRKKTDRKNPWWITKPQLKTRITKCMVESIYGNPLFCINIGSKTLANPMSFRIIHICLKPNDELDWKLRYHLTRNLESYSNIQSSIFVQKKQPQPHQNSGLFQSQITPIEIYLSPEGYE